MLNNNKRERNKISKAIKFTSLRIIINLHFVQSHEWLIFTGYLIRKNNAKFKYHDEFLHLHLYSHSCPEHSSHCSYFS